MSDTLGFLKTERNAVLTIELSLLMPGIMAVLILVIYAGYYYHDRCVIESLAYSAVLKTSYEKYPDEYEVDRLFQEAADKRLLGKWDMSENIKIYDDEIIMVVEGNMTFSTGGMLQYLKDILFSVNIIESAKRLNEPRYIRGRERGD